MLKSTLDNYLLAWNSGNAAKVLELCHPSIIYEDVAVKRILAFDALGEFITGAFERSPDLRFELVSACYGDDVISWEWIMHRTKGGVKSSTPGQSMTEFHEGKVIKNRDYWSELPTPTKA